jgi:nucleoside 2-deoxyribosyltransferase
MKSAKRNSMRLNVFLNSPLSYIAAQILNTKIREILEEEGFACILPQSILPPGPDADPKEVFRRNVEFVKRCDIVLSVLDAPGEGVIFELGVAHALKKPIIAFRSNGHSYLGKVIEGLWSTLPESQKATNLDELRNKLKHFHAVGSAPHEESKP